MRLGGTRLAAAALSAVMLLASAPHAAAADSEAVGDFRRLCLATGGEAAKVKAAAEREGWAPMSSDGDEAEEDVEVEATYVKMGSKPRLLLLMNGDVQPGLGGHGCLLGVDSSQASNLEAEISALAGVAQHKGITDEGQIWIYTDGGKGRRDLSGLTEEQILELAKTEPVKAIFLSPRGEVTIIALVDMVAQ